MGGAFLRMRDGGLEERLVARIRALDRTGDAVWLGDGAKENWTLASELCPFQMPTIAELMECIPLTETDEQLAALDQLVGYCRANVLRNRFAQSR